MNIYHQAIDMAERASKLGDILLRERKHELHRAGIACRDLSLQITQGLTSLSDEARKRIEEIA